MSAGRFFCTNGMRSAREDRSDQTQGGRASAQERQRETEKRRGTSNDREDGREGRSGPLGPRKGRVCHWTITEDATSVLWEEGRKVGDVGELRSQEETTSEGKDEEKGSCCPDDVNDLLLGQFGPPVRHGFDGLQLDDGDGSRARKGGRAGKRTRSECEEREDRKEGSATTPARLSLLFCFLLFCFVLFV